jgi:hypothetical protein
MIFESGLPFTILQPAPYMQNWSGLRSIGRRCAFRTLCMPSSVSSTSRMWPKQPGSC